MSDYLKIYPWSRLMNLYTGKIYQNRSAMDDMPEGWRLAFGDLMFNELDEAIKKAGVEDSFVVLQVKEKLGSLRFRHNQPRNSEIDIIVRKYELLSRFICLRCGMLSVKMVYAPWIRPMDFDCFCKTEHTDGSEYEEFTRPEDHNMPMKMVWEEFREIDKETGKHIYDRFEVDISETVEKIRKHWEERVANGTHIVESSKMDRTWTVEEIFDSLEKDLEGIEDENE